MLYLCIPAYNEAPTIGLLLWHIRKLFQQYSREHEILVFNDGSSDDTAEVLKPYADVVPLTVLGSSTHVGYAGALDALARAVSQRTHYPRRDAMLTLQADFTDLPEHLPELVKRFEGGADVVVAERAPSELPTPSRRLRHLARWVMHPFPSVPGVRDPFSALRLYRISVIRDMLKAAGDAPLASADGWAANAQMLLAASPFARRVETVELGTRYDLRPRETRRRAMADALHLFRDARVLRASGSAATPAAAPATPAAPPAS